LITTTHDWVQQETLMSKTPTAEEICHFIDAAFKLTCLDQDFVDKLKKVAITIKVVTTDPHATLVMDMAKQTVNLVQGDVPADATLRMSGDTANRFWQGKVNLLGAITRGAVKVQGHLPGVIRALPLAMKMYPSYVAELRKAGRTDLLVA
jgi:putative sterol carrier protein